MPDEADQQQATTLVRSLFEEDIRAAKTPADKSRLARRMIDVAADTNVPAKTNFTPVPAPPCTTRAG